LPPSHKIVFATPPPPQLIDKSIPGLLLHLFLRPPFSQVCGSIFPPPPPLETLSTRTRGQMPTYLFSFLRSPWGRWLVTPHCALFFWNPPKNLFISLRVCSSPFKSSASTREPLTIFSLPSRSRRLPSLPFVRRFPEVGFQMIPPTPTTFSAQPYLSGFLP